MRSVKNMTTDGYFNHIYIRTKPAITKYVSRRMLGDSSDTVNEIFLTAWRRRSDMPQDEDAQLMWLYAIGRRTIANTLRWRARLDRFNRATDALAQTSSVNNSSETTVVVHDCLSKLKKNDREILMLIEWDECNIHEAATILGITEAAATKRLKHARDCFISLYNSQSAAS
jgi:RNA polymerase sigma-70 factor (ECF subfamily)